VAPLPCRGPFDAAARLTRTVRRAALLVVAGLVLAWGITVTVLFGFPSEHAPAHADAVVVLAGGKKERLRRGLELMRRDRARVLVISDGWDPTWPEANRLCAGRASFRVLCFRASPYSTRGEAQGVDRLARQLGWNAVVVVTSTYHLTRARLLFDRCLEAKVDGVGVDYPVAQIPTALLSETAKLSYALAVGRSC